MKQERAEYIQIIKDLQGDLPGRQKALDFIRDSDIWVHGAPAPFPFVPYLFNKQDMEFITECCHMSHGILCKVIRKFLDDPSYRPMFNFPPEAEKLILLPCNYDQLLPMGRFDIFLDEDDFSYKFCEFNTDGSGAMSRDLMLAKALELSDTFKEFAKRHKVERFELIDSWVEAFMRIYRTDKNAVETPHVAVIDFKESGVFSDFNRFIEAFEKAGIPARFVDIRELRFDGEQLVDGNDGWPVHAIYRRSVTSEILKHPGECDDLINAVAAEKVCLIGHFRTTVVHSKMVNIALFRPETRAFLTDEECAFIDAHVPRTYILSADPEGYTIDEIKQTKDSWIIKPADDYAAHGVYPGVDHSQEEWETIVERHLDNGCIVQEFYPPRKVDIVLPQLPEDGDPCKVEIWQSMPGFYQYDGEPVGFYCRQGQEGVIAIDHGGTCSCSFKVDCD